MNTKNNQKITADPDARHWHRLVMGNGSLDFIIAWLRDADLVMYERVQIKICGNWYPAIRRLQ